MTLIPPDQLPIEQYHNSAPEWLSKTSLRDYAEHGPAWWRLAYLKKSIDRPSPGGALQGRALDVYLTEGAVAFARKFPQLPPDAPRKPDSRQRNAKKPSEATIEAIAWWDAWEAAHPNAESLNHEDRAILADAVDAVRRHPKWPAIEACLAQHTVARQSASLGLGLQSRPDWITPDGSTLYDLKKTSNLDSFGKQAIDLGYHLQAAIAGWCLAGSGMQLEHAYLVAVEWERGARCRVYEIPHEALQDGDRQMRELAAEIAGRLARDDWRDAPPDCETLPIPDWMLRRMEATHG